MLLKSLKRTQQSTKMIRSAWLLLRTVPKRHDPNVWRRADMFSWRTLRPTAPFANTVHRGRCRTPQNAEVFLMRGRLVAIQAPHPSTQGVGLSNHPLGSHDMQHQRCCFGGVRSTIFKMAVPFWLSSVFTVTFFEMLRCVYLCGQK